MDILLGAINTAVLSDSSLMVTFAVYSGQTGNRRLLSLFLVLTMVIGLVFLGIKFTEYYQHFQDHKAPGFWFNDSNSHAPSISNVLCLLLHYDRASSVHMIIGIGILAVLLFRTFLGTMSAEYHTPIRSAACIGISSISFGSFCTRSFIFRDCINERASAFAQEIHLCMARIARADATEHADRVCESGGWSTVIAIGIAAIMASLVAGFLMHAFYETKLIKLIISVAVIWFLILVSLTLGDYMTRGWLPFPGK